MDPETIAPSTDEVAASARSVPDLEAMIQKQDLKQDLHDYLDEVQKLMAMEAIAQEVELLCGARYARDTVHGGRYKRWGTNPGSIKIRSERIPVQVQRVQDTETKQARPLRTYRLLHRPTEKQQEEVTERIFLGLKQRDYERVAREFADSFGLSASSVSRTFQAHSAQVLREFEERDLSQATYVALMLDATNFKDRHVLICVGITDAGDKQVLGFVELTSENAEAASGLLEDLVRRGLRYEQGLLCVMDGAKGLRKAVQQVFGDYVQVQRCTWHKRENVLGKLERQKDQAAVKRQLNEAYNQETYDEAKTCLMSICEALQCEGHQRAANSLLEGMEETLTLHRLGVDKELRRSLRTTNIMEHLNSQLKASLRRIKRWVHSDQCHRWVAMALKEAEPRLKPIEHQDQLRALSATLLEQVQKQQLKSTSNWL